MITIYLIIGLLGCVICGVRCVFLIVDDEEYGFELFGLLCCVVLVAAVLIVT